MLILNRCVGEQVVVGECVVTVVKVRGHQVVLGFDAPERVRIVRGELPEAADVLGQTERSSYDTA